MAEQSRGLLVDSDRLSRQLLVLLVCTELFFVVLDIIVNYAEVVEYDSIQRLCNIAQEDGLAAWFMTSQTLVAALVLWLLYWLSRNTDEASAFYRRGWLVLALFFTYMSADDGAMMHERIGTMLEEIIKQSGQSGDTSVLTQWLAMFPSYDWQFLLPFFILMGLYMLYFLWRVLGISRSLWMVLAAFSCLALAVMLDFIEGLPADHAFNIFSGVQQAYMLEDYTIEHFPKALEEFLEMLGISLFLVVFVAQLGRAQNNLPSIKFTSSDSQ